MWVIKLGGSLLSSGSLKDWLSMIVQFGSGKLVVVPGGGVFADQVRIAQQQWMFDDTAAHHMALLAMQQYAYLFKSYEPDLSLTDSVQGIGKLINLNQLPVWLPFNMVTQCQDLSANWNLTSDSLTLWLANQLKAEHTLLVKSVDANGMNSRELSESGLVDKSFPEFTKTMESDNWWLDQNDMSSLKELLKKNAHPEDYLKPIVY